MLRLFVSASIFVIVLGLAGLPVRAQSSSDATSKSLRVAQSISPTRQEEQRAAKSVACRKQAKEQKLSGSERRAFLKDCITPAEAAKKLSDADRVALEKATAACKAEAKGMKFSWHWRKRQKYVKSCIIRMAIKTDPSVDVWQIRRAVNMMDLRTQQPGEWGCDPKTGEC